ncbi:MAG: transglutaminase domain-containing protein [Bacteroidetes bacterium]|nr:transglutaminase domain-containing protein [Bacteroidota bacterium]
MLLILELSPFDLYRGSNSSWEEYGKWIWEMNKGRDKLPQATIDMLNNMVKDIADDKEKVKAIYKYLQSRTRYVNIVLGIGGMQPFDAQTVDRNGYGDCKALSNYMVSMLKEVGIESYYTLVRAGSQRRDYRFSPDFVASQFNHVIVCVPLNGDTIYLECTSQINPFGHQGDFTDNRYVLIVREDGGHLRRTPYIPVSENAVNGNAVVKIDSQGNGSANVVMSFGGHFFSQLNMASRQNEEDQKKWLYSKDYLPNSTIERHSIKLNDNMPAIATVELQALLKTYANVSRNRIFIPVNLLSASKSTPPRIRNRVLPFELTFERSYSDTIMYIVPEGFVVETVPQNSFLDSEFGTYKSSTSVEGNIVKYIMYYESKSGHFPAEKYPEYFEFWQSIVRADNQNVTFRKE